MKNINWAGVFPAVTTQYNEDYSINIPATQNMLDALIKDGVDGIIALGTVGENYSLSAQEKRNVLAASKEVIDGRVPLLTGVAENTTALAVNYARDSEKIGVDGLMVLPGLIYKSNQRENINHFQQVVRNTGLPVMIYNNPISYGVDITVEMMKTLATEENIVAIKESSTSTFRITDIINEFGQDRFRIFCGVDNIAFESLLLGAHGWISGLTNVFPKESVAIFNLIKSGHINKALEIYRWITPLLHLDTIPTLVQCIKLAEQLVGRGHERIRAPRMILKGKERENVVNLVEQALANRPQL
ncbi:MAG: dihydrodipicolinate synthase family protein [Alcanivoracaceae bacterium]|nr:dihydrodipicolinate synthase family protein [Alcanivoracaceae bacterium]